jgi:uracil phosphoribosyltransferase
VTNTWLSAVALDLLPYEELVVNTPTGASFIGSQLSQPICGVSILRAGASMEAPLRKGCL